PPRPSCSASCGSSLRTACSPCCATSSESEMANEGEDRITVRGLTMAFGAFVVMPDLAFTVKRGSIFFIMCGTGCGKSTLLRHMIGLNEPNKGEVLYDGVNFTTASPEEREQMRRRFGVLYQSGALWSSMTLAENVGLPLGEFTRLSPEEIDEVAALNLARPPPPALAPYLP